MSHVHPIARTDKDYVAGRAGFIYPGLGEGVPPGGAKLLLLNEGGVVISGFWTLSSRHLAWSPMPRRSDYTFPSPDGEGIPGSGTLLLLTIGGICVFGPWSNDGRYLGWAPMPARDRRKEDALKARNQPAWPMAA